MLGGVGIGASIWLPFLVLFGPRLITRLHTNTFLFKWIWTTPAHCSPSETRPLDFIFSDDTPCTHHLS